MPEYFSATWWMTLHLRIYRLYLFIIQMYKKKKRFTWVTFDNVSAHLNEELHSSMTLNNSVSACVIRCSKLMENLTSTTLTIMWRWKLYLKFLIYYVLNLLKKYNFILDWHVHWFICTAVYVLISFIIVSWYWYVTVFGLPLFVILFHDHESSPMD